MIISLDINNSGNHKTDADKIISDEDNIKELKIFNDHKSINCK